MTIGICIYCKQEKDLNVEHAFPKSLLDKKNIGTKYEWIIDKHVCVDCNGLFGKELDGILLNASPIGFIQHKIQSELGNRTNAQHATFYNSTKFKSIHPVRLFFTDPIYNDLIAMHEHTEITSDVDVEGYFDSIGALYPQIILVQHPHEQTSEQAIAEDCENFNNPDSSVELETHVYENNKEYYKFGNTLVFPPKTTETFRKERQQKDFINRFLNKVRNIEKSMWIICPETHSFHSTLMAFHNSLSGEKDFIEEESFSTPELFTRQTKVIIDPKAKPHIERAIAKIAFHCLLYHYPTFHGHEPIFSRIKEFIHHGIGKPNQIISPWRNRRTENITFNTCGHCYHGISFYFKNNNIGCMIDLFMGLFSSPFSFRINLAGKPHMTDAKKDKEEKIPFSVHPKSQNKRRILSPDSTGLIIDPSKDKGVLGRF